MYRQALSRTIPCNMGRSSNSFVSQFATASAMSRKSLSDGGLFSWLTGEKSNSLPPLYCPLEGVNLPSPIPDYVAPSKTKISTLSNGFRVASETSCNPAVSIGLYVECGSVHENSPEFRGASHLLEKRAFRSTTNRSCLRIVREVEAIGGHLYYVAGREQMGYSFDALKTYVPRMVELLVDCVRNPSFLDWEVAEQLQYVRAELQMLSMDPQALLLEALHFTGHMGPLANPLLGYEATVKELNSNILEDFVTENYTAPRMVLAASGVEHEELLTLAEPLLSDLPNVPHVKTPTSIHLWWKLPMPGSSYSNEHQEIQYFSAFNDLYNDTGIFGIHASTGAHFAGKAIDLAAKELISFGTSGQVLQVELDRAKEATKSALVMNLESRMNVTEDMGMQILTFGERKPVERYLQIIDAITFE